MILFASSGKCSTNNFSRAIIRLLNTLVISHEIIVVQLSPTTLCLGPLAWLCREVIILLTQIFPIFTFHVMLCCFDTCHSDSFILIITRHAT